MVRNQKEVKLLALKQVKTVDKTRDYPEMVLYFKKQGYLKITRGSPLVKELNILI